jgi:D-aminopeptidase
MTNGSGDYVIAFSTAESVRRSGEAEIAELSNSAMSPLFQAVIETTEEAIYNSLLMAETATYEGPDGETRTVEALPVDAVRAMIAERD